MERLCLVNNKSHTNWKAFQRGPSKGSDSRVISNKARGWCNFIFPTVIFHAIARTTCKNSSEHIAFLLHKTMNIVQLRENGGKSVTVLSLGIMAIRLTRGAEWWKSNKHLLHVRLNAKRPEKKVFDIIKCSVNSDFQSFNTHIEKSWVWIVRVISLSQPIKLIAKIIIVYSKVYHFHKPFLSPPDLQKLKPEPKICKAAAV